MTVQKRCSKHGMPSVQDLRSHLSCPWYGYDRTLDRSAAHVQFLITQSAGETGQKASARRVLPRKAHLKTRSTIPRMPSRHGLVRPGRRRCVDGRPSLDHGIEAHAEPGVSDHRERRNRCASAQTGSSWVAARTVGDTSAHDAEDGADDRTGDGAILEGVALLDASDLIAIESTLDAVDEQDERLGVQAHQLARDLSPSVILYENGLEAGWGKATPVARRRLAKHGSWDHGEREDETAAAVDARAPTEWPCRKQCHVWVSFCD